MINTLRQVFPDKLPALAKGERLDDFGIGYLYGNREVIDRLQIEYDYQQEELINNNK